LRRKPAGEPCPAPRDSDIGGHFSSVTISRTRPGHALRGTRDLWGSLASCGGLAIRLRGARRANPRLLPCATSKWRVTRPQQSARMLQSTRWRQHVHVALLPACRLPGSLTHPSRSPKRLKRPELTIIRPSIRLPRESSECGTILSAESPVVTTRYPNKPSGYRR